METMRALVYKDVGQIELTESPSRTFPTRMMS